MYQGIKITVVLFLLVGLASATGCDSQIRYGVFDPNNGYYLLGDGGAYWFYTEFAGTNMSQITKASYCWCNSIYDCRTLINEETDHWSCEDMSATTLRNNTNILLVPPYRFVGIPEYFYYKKILLEFNTSGNKQWNTMGDPTNISAIDIVTEDDFGRRYNLYFKNEETNTPYNFTAHPTSKLEIYCPTLKTTTEYTLTTSNITIYPLENPTLFIRTDNSQQRRDRLLTTADNGNVSIYLLNNRGSTYTFNLVDYTARFTNAILEIKKTVSGVNQIVYNNYFDPSRNIYVSLQNNTGYSYRVYTQSGNVRDLGIMSLQSDDTLKSIEITDVDLNGDVNKYGGGLSLSLTKDYDTKTISFNYESTSCQLQSTNFTVYDMNQTPYLKVYGTTFTPSISDTCSYPTSGQSNYVVPNENHTYYVYMKAINNGMVVERTSVVWLTNQSRRLLELNLPTTIMGASASSIYRGLAGLILVVTILGFGAVDVGLGLLMCSVMIISLNYVWSPDINIPWYLIVVCLFLAVASFIGQRRNITE